MLECVGSLVSERIEDAGVRNGIEDTGVVACWDIGVGVDRDEIKIGMLVSECVDESGSEIWDWRHEIETGTALQRDLEREIWSAGSRSRELGGWRREGDGDEKALTRSGLALQRRS